MNSRRKKSFPYPLRDFIDADYLQDLTEEERNWYYQFENEFYNNNHRKGTIIKESPDYESKIKKELDSQNNAARRDVYANNTRVTVRSNDLCNIIYNSYSSYITDSLKLKGIEGTIQDLIEDTAIDLIELGAREDLETLKNKMSRLCIDVTKALQLEKKYRKNRRRK